MSIFHHISHSPRGYTQTIPRITVYLYPYITAFVERSPCTIFNRNPAPSWMVETIEIVGETTYQLVQDFATIYSSS